MLFSIWLLVSHSSIVRHAQTDTSSGNTAAHCQVSSGCVSGCSSVSASNSITSITAAPSATSSAQWITATIDGVVVSWIWNPSPSALSVASTTPAPAPRIIASSNVVHLATSSSAGEPVLGQDTTAIASATPAPTGAVTTDGTCGATHGGTVCGDWPMGSCCSSYGWCGNTTAHCGKSPETLHLQYSYSKAF